MVRVGVLAGMALTAISCGTGQISVATPAHTSIPAKPPAMAVSSPTTTVKPPATTQASASGLVRALGSPLPVPGNLTPFSAVGTAGEGVWIPSGRSVGGVAAVYETLLVPPGGSQAAGIAWMDTALLSARLYSGSMSPGGGPYRYTAPIQPAQAASLVAAFNGGFVMKVAGGGYYTEGRMVDPLVAGAASLVIYTDGSVNVGAWGTDVAMTPSVVSVRQNLVPLVAAGQPTPQAASPNWQAWGATCGATSCSGSVPGIEHQWRSGIGITADGALVYAAGPALDPLQLAELLVRAGVVRAMQLDINPDWPVLATYSPRSPGGLAAPSNGSKLLASTVQGPWTFFESWWARDFVTMSARPVVASRLVG
ncbi:MAG: phosphodiester glycosidase family protein [Acidimicrobiales bacterium]